MASKKVYAVKNGRVPGLYDTWAECEKQVKGYPGAIFKGFATREEAVAFIGGSSESVMDIAEPDVSLEETYLSLPTNKAVAYVDGSFNVATGEYAFGAVIFHNGKEHHFNGKSNDAELATMRNVAGEIDGSKCAMKYAVDNGVDEIDIYYDYQGIESWCTGAWKTNKEGTIAYKAFYDDIKDKLKVNFKKVKGHSGDKYNDKADELAKQAVGIV